MFDIGLQEMLVIGVIALLVFGPGKLPELGRKVGKLMREFRRASDEFRSTVETNLQLNEPEPAIQPPAPGLVSEPATATLPSEAEPAIGDAAAATATEPAVEHGEPYCAKRGARLYHRRDCTWVARIPEVERVYLKRMAEAEEQGLAKCPSCEPWEPAA
jgi:Tat protein translocase TatB subunit